MDKGTFEWSKYIKECFDSTTFCSMGTIDPKGVWVNPVFFAYDTHANLYFISQMPSRHMQNLKQNTRISMAIYKTNQTDHVVGSYLEGTANILTESAEIEEAHKIYFNRAGTGEDVQQYINNPTWIFVKVIPDHLYYFDTRFFEEERVEVPLDKVSL